MWGKGYVQSQGLLLVLQGPKLFTSVCNHLLQIEVKAATYKVLVCVLNGLGGEPDSGQSLARDCEGGPGSPSDSVLVRGPHHGLWLDCAQAGWPRS